MDIQEVRNEKKLLEKKIVDLMTQFYNDTGIYVKTIKLKKYHYRKNEENSELTVDIVSEISLEDL